MSVLAVSENTADAYYAGALLFLLALVVVFGALWKR